MTSSDLHLQRKAFLLHRQEDTLHTAIVISRHSTKHPPGPLTRPKLDMGLWRLSGRTDSGQSSPELVFLTTGMPLVVAVCAKVSRQTPLRNWFSVEQVHDRGGYLSWLQWNSQGGHSGRERGHSHKGTGPSSLCAPRELETNDLR